jgi:hypothetical protein
MKILFSFFITFLLSINLFAQNNQRFYGSSTGITSLPQGLYYYFTDLNRPAYGTGTGLNIGLLIADTGSTWLKNWASSQATGNLQSIMSNGATTTVKYSGTNMALSGYDSIGTCFITHNAPDGTIALTITQLNSSSTGYYAEGLNSSGSVKWLINTSGTYEGAGIGNITSTNSLILTGSTGIVASRQVNDATNATISIQNTGLYDLKGGSTGNYYWKIDTGGNITTPGIIFGNLYENTSTASNSTLNLSSNGAIFSRSITDASFTTLALKNAGLYILYGEGSSGNVNLKIDTLGNCISKGSFRPMSLFTDTFRYSSTALKRIDTLVTTLTAENVTNGYYLNTIDSGNNNCVIGEGSGSGETINGYDAANHIRGISQFELIGAATYQNNITNSIASGIIHGMHCDITGSNGHNGIIVGSLHGIEGTSGYSAIVAGTGDSIFSASNAFIGSSGSSKIDTSNYGFIGAGLNELIHNSIYGFIGSGVGDSIKNSLGSVILDGFTNDIINSNYSFQGVCAVCYNYNSQLSGVIVGQNDSIIRSNYGLILNGKWNKLDTSYYAEVGGYEDSIRFSQNSDIVNGNLNLIDSSTYSFIGDGQGNIITKNSNWSNIVGGYYNIIGSTTTLSNYGQYDFIGGGLNNAIGTSGSARFSSIACGRNDSIQTEYSAIGYGENCKTSGNGNFQFAAGDGAISTNLGSVAWADGTGNGCTTSTNNTFNLNFSGGYVFKTGIITLGNLPNTVSTGDSIVIASSSNQLKKQSVYVAVDTTTHYATQNYVNSTLTSGGWKTSGNTSNSLLTFGITSGTGSYTVYSGSTQIAYFQPTAINFDVPITDGGGGNLVSMNLSNRLVTGNTADTNGVLTFQQLNSGGSYILKFKDKGGTIVGKIDTGGNMTLGSTLLVPNAPTNSQTTDRIAMLSSSGDSLKSVSTSNILPTVVAGSGISISSSGTPVTYTISTTSTGITDTTITSNVTAKPYYRYYVNSSSLITITLPATFSTFNPIQVIGVGTGGWKIAQNAGQTIHSGTSANTTTGTAGYLQSQTQYSCISLRAISTTDFVIDNSQGSPLFN